MKSETSTPAPPRLRTVRRPSVYGRTREAAGYDFAERSGKLDAQREVGTGGTRGAARIGEQRRQADNFGYAQGAAAAGVSTREAARLDSFMTALTHTAGNQVDLAEGGASSVADRARNERLSKVVENERLSRMQALFRENGINLTKRQIAMDQNGDLSLNLTPQIAAQMWQSGLINESQLGAIANGGHARFSFAHNDLLVSSSTGFSRSARSDTSTRFEAGKQAGPDTVEHFLGGSAEGQSMMADWLRGGFEMDRRGNWRLKPQVVDTLTRDVSAIMAQTGWDRSIARAAQDQASMGTEVGGQIGGETMSGASRDRSGSAPARSGAGSMGRVGGTIAFSSSETGLQSENAQSSLNVVNHDVRSVIAAAEKSASRSLRPEDAFVRELRSGILGSDGLRNRYLREGDAGRGTFDITSPVTSLEQSSLLNTGRFSTDIDRGPGDGNSEFKGR
jgi:conjugal transfer mating pair stabilization protein TraG